MPKFNLMHCMLHSRAHGLTGYKEVIDTVGWGLGQLGYDVKYSVNTYERDHINIVFGAQVLPIEKLKELPANSIVYNFEQMRNLAEANIRPEVRFVAGHFQLWDYNRGNLEAWARIGAPNVKVVPVGYAPVLTTILKPAVQDIDVLIYGIAGEKRLRAFSMLSQAGLTSVFISGLYGEARDQFIARSKLILNVNLYDHSRVFEIVRVSYLLSNRKAVVAILDEGMEVEDDVKSCVTFATFDSFLKQCLFLADNAQARNLLEEYGFSVFSQRDIRKILASALTV